MVFGREALTEHLLVEVTARPSGTGKSSLIPGMDVNQNCQPRPQRRHGLVAWWRAYSTPMDGTGAVQTERRSRFCTRRKLSLFSDHSISTTHWRAVPTAR